MKIIVKIGIIVLNIINTIIKTLPIKNKITFISRQSNNPSIDILLLNKKLNNKFEVIILCKTLDKGVFNMIKYFFHMFRQMYHIATSKVVILDSYCILISVLRHKKNLKIIQMWHALGAFKKFGKSIINKKDGNVGLGYINRIKYKDISSIMGMHQNYNYIFASSEKVTKSFGEAFGYELNNFKILPLPRLDLIKDKKNIETVKKRIYKKYPILNQKQNILYCPTFRKDNSDYEKIIELINGVDYIKYNFILKLHPLTNYIIKDERIIQDCIFDTYEMGFVSDIIITDYSAIVFEIAAMKKQIYFYAYDKKDYINNRDFYLDYHKEMPGPVCGTVKELFNHIDNKQYNIKKVVDFRKKYINDCNVSYTDDIVTFILSIIE